MKSMSSRLIAISTAIGFSLISPSAFATLVTVNQDYIILAPTDKEILRNTLITANFGFDDGSSTGIGVEFIPILSMDLLFSDRGLAGLSAGLNFSSAVDSNTVGNFKARIDGGDFQKLGGSFGAGGIAFAGFSPGADGFNLIAFNFTGTFGTGVMLPAGTRLTSLIDITGVGAPRITVTPVPLPAALPLFLSAFAGLGFFGWRRKSQALA